jgi:acetyl-CoA carboxylase carboxyl transferase subunit alpha
VLKEPLGAAHRDPQAMAETLKAAILDNLAALQKLPIEDLVARRYQRLRSFGVFSEN